MKFYIAARYDKRFDQGIQQFRRNLEAQGHTCTARWLDNAEESKGLTAAAQMDVIDVDAADVLIFIGEPRGSVNRGGGRWFELGVAWSLGKECVIYLPPALDPDDLRMDESVFTHLPDMKHFNDLDELASYVGTL